MRKVIRANKWHSVEVRTRMAHLCDRVDGYVRDIWLAADQNQRQNSTYLTPRAARSLAAVLLVAADDVEKSKVKP